MKPRHARKHVAWYGAAPDRALFPVRELRLAGPDEAAERASREDRAPDWRDRRRRLLDIAVALPALAVFGLLLPFIAVAIKLDSPGPVFYRQERIGVDRRRLRDRRGGMRVGRREDRRSALRPGLPFDIWKLRTMRQDAEETGPRLADAGDSRITRVGRFLRKTRLDEVPQFLNVLKGEMSLIGPRPERLCFIRHYEIAVPGYLRRHLVMPGITGLAQVENGYDDGVESVRRKVDLDTRYIRRRSWWLDLRIILDTIKVIFTGRGAH